MRRAFMNGSWFFRLFVVSTVGVARFVPGEGGLFFWRYSLFSEGVLRGLLSDLFLLLIRGFVVVRSVLWILRVDGWLVYVGRVFICVVGVASWWLAPGMRIIR